jgi:hypothetical protein
VLRPTRYSRAIEVFGGAGCCPRSNACAPRTASCSNASEGERRAAAAARPRTTVFGEDAYPAFEDKAAALLHSLVRNHALVDGNERLAWAAARVFHPAQRTRPDLHHRRC